MIRLQAGLGVAELLAFGGHVGPVLLGGAEDFFFNAQAQGGDGPPQGGQGDGQPQPVAEFFQGRVRGFTDGLPEPVGVGGPARLASGGGDAWGEFAAVAAAAAAGRSSDPGLADGVLGGDGGWSVRGRSRRGSGSQVE